MLTEREIMNNAFKELMSHEDNLAKKYAELQKEMTEPQLQSMIQSFEMAARTRSNMLSKKMNALGIV